MLTRDYRPRSFSELRGAELPKKALKSIVLSPEKAPQSIILAGEYGSGKTSSSKIFAKAINCESHTGDACNRCEHCTTLKKGSSLYLELDSAVMGNVEAMRQIRDSVSYSLQDGYRIVCIEEAQLCSAASQATLLTVLEEAPVGVFFVFNTTDIEKLLPTICSRSLILEFPLLEESEVKELVLFVSQKEGIEISEEVVRCIVRRSKGHARDALQQLELFRLVKDSYKDGVLLLEEGFATLIQRFKEGKKEEAKEKILRLLQQPVAYISQDFGVFIRGVADRVFIQNDTSEKRDKSLIFTYLRNQRFLKSTNDWYLFLLALGDIYKPEEKSSSSSRFSKV